MSKQYVLVTNDGKYLKDYVIEPGKYKYLYADSIDDACRFANLKAARMMGKEILETTHMFFGPEPYPQTERTNTAQKIYPDASGTLIPDLRSQETTETENNKKETWDSIQIAFNKAEHTVPIGAPCLIYSMWLVENFNPPTRK